MELEAEYIGVLEIIQKQLKLSPYDPEKKSKLIINGANTIDTGFLLLQHLNDIEPEKGFQIMNASSCLLPEGKDFSPAEAEVIELDKAITNCHHCLYYCNELELLSDCEGLLVRRS